MLLTTAGIAVARKIQSERDKKKVERQGLLRVGDSEVAKRAFATQTQKAVTDAGAGNGISRAGSDIRFEDPHSVDAKSPDTPDTASPGGLLSEKLDIKDARSHTSKTKRRGTVKSEETQPAVASPIDDGRPRSRGNSMPQPYSRTSRSYSTHVASPSLWSKDSDGDRLATSDTRSLLLRTSSSNSHALRIRTKGPDLKSDFPYHPGLFDLQVHPQMWDSFTDQIIDSTKFTTGDTAQMWAAAGATAMTGAIIPSVWVGRTMNRTIQEKKVKAGLEDHSNGGLGDTLQQWNETYFKERGLFVHLELSESALKNANQRSRIFQRPTLGYSKQEDRDRKREERKFVIVMTKLDDEGLPVDAPKNEIHELVAEAAVGVPDIPEMPAEDAKYHVAEMPGDEVQIPVELTAMELPSCVSLGYGDSKFGAPADYAEHASDSMALLGKAKVEDDGKNTDGKLEVTF